jgi:hypothetical protein
MVLFIVYIAFEITKPPVEVEKIERSRYHGTEDNDICKRQCQYANGMPMGMKTIATKEMMIIHKS